MSRRTSALQIEILTSLTKRRAISVVSVSRDLGRIRASVSRSLHNLRRDGFVCKDGRVWTITHSGRQELLMRVRPTIFLLAIRDKKARRKHDFWWREGDPTGSVLQHANLWVHPEYTFDLMLTVLQKALSSHEDTVELYLWRPDIGAWWLHD